MHIVIQIHRGVGIDHSSTELGVLPAWNGCGLMDGTELATAILPARNCGLMGGMGILRVGQINPLALHYFHFTTKQTG